MNESIFRKKSIEKVQSPEQLNDYLRVTNPGVWLILTAVIVLLVGALVWGAFGHLDTVVQVEAAVEKGEAVCTLPDEAAARIAVGMDVRLGEAEGTVTAVDGNSATVRTDAQDGVYAAEIVIESVKPLSFIVN